MSTYWVYGPIGGATVALARSTMGSGGQGGSTLTVTDAIRDLAPSAILGVGIAFGIDERTQPIGQVLLSQKLTSYELQRIGKKDGKPDIKQRGPSTESSSRLLGRFRDARLGDQGIDVLTGEVLSGEKLLDNPEFKSALIRQFPDAIGGEMEGAGLQSASGRGNIDWLVVKAVCDYAENKSLEKEARQKVAAETVASAVMYVLERGGVKARKLIHAAEPKPSGRAHPAGQVDVMSSRCPTGDHRSGWRVETTLVGGLSVISAGRSTFATARQSGRCCLLGS